jgi:predicted site-specific integrase-resolvase
MLRPKEVVPEVRNFLTLRDYVKQGRIAPVVLEGGAGRFREKGVERLMGIVRKRKMVLYARFSSMTQKDVHLSRKVGKTFVCERCGFTLDRQLNASLNIYLKMCEFPRLDSILSRWVGVYLANGAEEGEGDGA